MTSENADTNSRTTVLAERFKTKLCRNWVTSGHCPYEQRCMFAHGEDELRSREWNIRDGLTSETAIKEFQRKFYAPNRGGSYANQSHTAAHHHLASTHSQPVTHQPYASYDGAYAPAAGFMPSMQRSGLGCAPHEPMYNPEGLCACSQCIAAQHQTVLAQQQQLQQMYNLYFAQSQQQPSAYNTSPVSSDSNCEQEFAGVPQIFPVAIPEAQYVRRSSPEKEKTIDPLISAFSPKPMVECP